MPYLTPVSDKSNKTGDCIPVFVVIIVQHRKKCKNIFYKNFTRFSLVIILCKISEKQPGRSPAAPRVLRFFLKEIEHAVKIDFLADREVVFGSCQVVQQKLQQHCAAEGAALDLEMGKAHGQIDI